ncbi:hypothetical protein [Bifidobacterium simiarum]|uniref:hypothetical protein n=1 Tax=Bifidobacterium simiarum TaxID=2045441 RepID=UPI001F0B42D4|nr:hypothetical protein [Bifidobacterium simiarum]
MPSMKLMAIREITGRVKKRSDVTGPAGLEPVVLEPTDAVDAVLVVIFTRLRYRCPITFDDGIPKRPTEVGDGITMQSLNTSSDRLLPGRQERIGSGNAENP